MSETVPKRSSNFNPVISAETNDASRDVKPLLVDPTTGRLLVDASLGALDIEIGAVELKNGADDTRAIVNAANTARAATNPTLLVQPLDAAGNVLGRTAANTARTTGTLVDPVQVVDAAGNVLSVSAANTARTTGTLVVPTQLVDAAGNVYNLTAANTARTTATVVQPTQHIDAAGTVGGFTLNTLISGEDQTNDVLKVEERGTISYKASAGADQVVKAAAGFLYGIILGTWVDNAVLEVSDHASDGDGNVVILLTGDTTDSVDHDYPKYIPVNASFANGITADITAFTNVTFIYR